ncbi:MAG TPA: Maf family nucleotide pyrophosphatase [Flavobacteriaceae bacterium]|nr:Maf family nucleotide pyrophosphatase [Flavobacteriaceae bacterium]
MILASASPRRQELLKSLGVNFEIRLKSVKETYPKDLKSVEVPDYLAKLKASVFTNLESDEILITGDTVVVLDDKILGKPQNKAEAAEMLRALSEKSHEVISSICLKSTEKIVVSHEVTKVYFKKLSEAEIEYYLNNFKPYDKAGAYGIQEWIGQIGIHKIEGSYFNVVGLPVHLLYEMLMNF